MLTSPDNSEIAESVGSSGNGKRTKDSSVARRKEICKINLSQGNRNTTPKGAVYS